MKKPNIIFIFSDQHSGKVMGNMGDEVIRTPNLDKLAEQGANFTNNYCNSPVCVPSRSSLLTSTLPSDTGIVHNDFCLPSDMATMAHSIGLAGYESVLSGRMHFMGADQLHGFEKRLVGDFMWSYPGMRSRHHEKIWVGQDKMTYVPGKFSIDNTGGGSSSILCYDEDVTNASCDYIKNRTDERPLFMTIGLFGPHNIYVSPKEYFEYYYDKVEVPEITKETRERLPRFQQILLDGWGIRDITEEDIRRSKAAYYGMIQYMDDLIGQILQSIEETLGMENTIMIHRQIL